jgi:Transposase.
MQRKNLTFLTAKKFKVCQYAGKVMASVFWDAKGVIHVEFKHEIKAINGKAYSIVC